jgi:hypothetical protein
MEEDGWDYARRIDYLRRKISNGMCEIVVSTVKEVTIWQLHKNKFLTDKVVNYVDHNLDGICKRLMRADKEAVPEYLIEYIQGHHDLKKSANGLRRFLNRKHPRVYGPSETKQTQTQGGAGGSKKWPIEKLPKPPSKQGSNSLKKAKLPSQAGGSSRETEFESRSPASKLKLTVKRPKKLASQNVGSTSKRSVQRLERMRRT